MSQQANDRVVVREAVASDTAAIAEIYNHYVEHTVITFEEEPVAVDEMARRVEKVRAAFTPSLVAVESGRVIGFAYASPWNIRSAYRFSAESTVYLAPGYGGHGIGSKLYEKLFSILREKGIHTVIGGVALPNDASVALHEKFGMRKVAHYSEVGFKFGRWIDVGYWQRVF